MWNAYHVKIKQRRNVMGDREKWDRKRGREISMNKMNKEIIAYCCFLKK